MACPSVQLGKKSKSAGAVLVEHGADFSGGFLHAPTMRSCTGLYLHGDVILQQKLEKQGGYTISSMIYAKLSTTMQPPTHVIHMLAGCN